MWCPLGVGVVSGMSADIPVLASAVVGLHEWFSWFVVSVNGIVGLWALIAHKRHSWRGSTLWGLTVVAQVSVLVQVGLGSWLIAQDNREIPELHAVYGFSTLITIGIAYSYRHQLQKHLYLLYGCTGLFLMGLGIRAMILD